ncbi:MAG: hypothetical protein JOY93_04290 [Acidobacteriales bacterium]|nr:hypothetical protein [Terriglobales bacterium]
MRLNTLSKEKQLLAYYKTLHRAWGSPQWWPARTRFEVIVGAYLTQNTSWNNVEKAIRNLRRAKCLSLAGVRNIALSDLESLIRPAGYFRQKAERLKIFVAFVEETYGGSLSRMFRQPTAYLRQQLLSLKGIGPETADAILLYAGQHASFVIDAYTRRILERHQISSMTADYEELRTLWERALAPLVAGPGAVAANQGFLRRSSDAAPGPSPMSRMKRSALAQIYNDMHGMIVTIGKVYCLKGRPLCEECPLKPFLPRPGTIPI